MRRTFFTLIALLAITLLPAQTLNYPTDTIRGKVYYLYPVQKGEGLYRISKNFGVSQEAIIKANPMLETQGLKLGQTIRIPVVKKPDTSKYIAHEIQPKETLYGLSKRYGVTIEAIQALNPEVSKRMAIGTTLLIPRESEKVKQMKAETPTIKERFKPQETERKEPTPKLEKKEPTAKIEKKEPTAKVDIGKLFGTKTDTLVTDSLVADTIIPQKTIRMAFLLPLMTNQAKRTAAVDRFVEFYEGALIALYEAQRIGQRFEIYVYDTEKNDVRIQTILQQPEMQNMHAIIGPAYPSQITHVSKFAYTHQIPTLIPFTNKVPDIDTNPYLWQFNPPVESETDTLFAYIERTYPAAHYVFIDLDTDKPATSTTLFKQHIKAKKASMQTISAAAVLNDSLSYALKANKENIIIFNTEKIAQLPLLLEKVRVVKNTYSLTLFSHYAWQDDLLPIRSFYASVFNKSKLVNIPLSMYSMKYKHFFGHELQNTQPRYDLLGYDLTTYFIQMLQSDAPSTPYQGLQSDIHFKQVSEHGGYENAGIQIMTK